MASPVDIIANAIRCMNIDTTPEQVAERIALNMTNAGFGIVHNSQPDDGWNYDMSQAPRDGTKFDAWSSERHIEISAGPHGWLDHNGRALATFDSPFFIAWRYLPAPPKQKGR